MSITDTIADKLLDRSVDLARLEAGERRKVIGMLLAMEKEIIARLKAIDPTAPKFSRYQRDRLDKLLIEVQAITRSTYRRINSDQQRVMTGVAVAEAPVVAEVVNLAVGVNLVSAGLGEARLRALVDDHIILGNPAKEWWGQQAATTQELFKRLMRQGMLNGHSLSQMVRETATLIERKRVFDAEALVRTSLQSVQNAVRSEIFNANSDVLDGVQIISTLDTRTCPICQALSGKAYTMERKPIGHAKPWPGNPPFHFSCRCTVIAIPSAFADLRQARGVMLQKQLDALDAGKIREIDGSLVGDMNFSQWLRTKPEQVQRQVLGRGRFDLWKAKKITIDQLTDQSHRPLTLKELERVA